MLEKKKQHAVVQLSPTLSELAVARALHPYTVASELWNWYKHRYEKANWSKRQSMPTRPY